jgi:putative heme-binding domain-containing protein
MKSILLTAILFVVGLAGAEEDRERQLRLVRENDPLPPEEERTRLRVPEGFTVQLFASEPMINKPINLAFDDRGRLWVSSTVEYPYAAAKDRWADPQGSRVKDSRDAIKILEDTNGDGKADKVTDFADGLNIPTGVLPWHKPEHKGGCIAWSIPNIWYFADTDGDGKCDLREVLFGPLGYEKDTHGMCSSFRMGTDGWVYATHGFNNTSHLKAKDGSTLDLHSGNVFRFRPDGSHVEIFAWGQVNPFGLCWDRRGNLYSADCHSNPITQLIRGAYYPSFGKPHDGLGHAPNMCKHSHGSTGLCGITYIDGGIWGPEWDDHMLLGNCVTSKVNHDKITFTGTTPQAREKPDFITSEDPWFRPVDLQLGPDNALYVADFYNRIIGHYEVPLNHPGRDRERGRIWRVVKTGAAKNPRPAPPAPETRHLADLRAADPFVRRDAAAWFAGHPEAAAAPLLLAALQGVDPADAQLQHQLRIALREHLKLDGAFAALSTPADIATALSIATAVPTAEAAAFVFQRWNESPAPETGRLTHLARYGAPDLLESVIQTRSANSESPHADQVAAITALNNGLMERGLKTPAGLLAWATTLTEALLADTGRSEPNWQEFPHPGSTAGDSPWCQEERKSADGTGIPVLSSLDRGRGGTEKLTGILRSRAFPAPDTLSFWLCGHRGAPGSPAHEKNLVRLVSGGRTVRQAFPPRSDTAGRIDWDLRDLKGQSVTLEIVDGDEGGAYAWLGAGRFDHKALDPSTFRSAGLRTSHLQTLAALLRTTAPVGLRDRLAPYLPKSASPAKAAPQPEIDALIKSRTATFASSKPDPGQGGMVFKTHCAACHQIKGQGGLIGPQLDGIGSRGAERLIEDILDPNRNVDTHFRLHSLKLRDGSTATGFIRGEVGQTTLLVDAAGNEQRIAKGDIAENAELAQSLMPPAFGQLIEPAAFNHLLGWLLTQ